MTVDMLAANIAAHWAQSGMMTLGLLVAMRLLNARQPRFRLAALQIVLLAAVTLALIVVAGTTTYVAGAAVPMRVVGRPDGTALEQLPDAQRQLEQSATGFAQPRRRLKPVYAEYPKDALDKSISGTVVADIIVDPAGYVTQANVVGGPQELRAAALKGVVGLKYTASNSTTSMRVYVVFSLSTRGWGVRLEDDPSVAGTPMPFYWLPPRTIGVPDSTGAHRVGGSLRPPQKIVDVPPTYPAEALEARVEGAVVIEARIDESGNVSDRRVLRSIPLLDAAATDAVKQWKYVPTLMNGAPVPIIMTVTVNFALRGSDPAPHVRLSITLPAGFALDERVQRPPVVLLVSSGGVGQVTAINKTVFGFHPILRDPADGTPVRVAIYRMRPAVREQPVSGGPELLGTVDVAAGGGIVYSPTDPSFGIELLGVEQR